jgi:hypothetical protein
MINDANLCRDDVFHDLGSGLGHVVMLVALLSGAPAIGVEVEPAMDSTNVYWIEPGSGSAKRVPLGGGTVVTLASGLNSPWGIAVDSTNVYWTEYAGGTVNGGKVRTATK